MSRGIKPVSLSINHLAIKSSNLKIGGVNATTRRKIVVHFPLVVPFSILLNHATPSMVITNPNSPIDPRLTNSTINLTNMLASLSGFHSMLNSRWTPRIISEIRYIGTKAKKDGFTSLSISSSPVKRNFSLSEFWLEVEFSGSSVSTCGLPSSTVSVDSSSSDIITSPN